MVVLLAAIAVAAVGVFRASASHIRSTRLPAQANMSALRDPATSVLPNAVPAALANLPGDVAPGAGAAHALLTKGAYAAYAWAAGNSRVCGQDTYGNGGCFTTFEAPFLWTVADPDKLGSGAPIYVTGFVPDNVTAMSIVVNGVSHPALVSHNAVYYELPDASLYPAAVQAFRVRFADGSEQVMAHESVLPASLK